MLNCRFGGLEGTKNSKKKEDFLSWKIKDAKNKLGCVGLGYNIANGSHKAYAFAIFY